jgi:hypothetical protein
MKKDMILNLSGMFLPDEPEPKTMFHENEEKSIEDLFKFNRFHGIIYNENDAYAEGVIHDHYGKATLGSIVIEDDKLEFRKIYLAEAISDPLDYTFIKKNGIWVGTYRDEAGKNTGACWAMGKFIPKLFLKAKHVKGFITF